MKTSSPAARPLAGAALPTVAAPPATGRTAMIVAFATIYVLWGSTYLGIRITLETMPPFLMAGARFMIAGVILLTVLKLRGAAWPTARQWGINAIIGTFLLFGGNGGVVWAEQYVPSGIAALIVGASPLFFVLTEWAWPGGSRPTVVMMLALLLGFGGVAWLAAPWETAAAGAVPLAGVGVILLGSISWAFGSIYSRHAQHGADLFIAAAMQMIGGGAVLLLAALPNGDYAHVSVATISTRAWVAFAYLITFGSLVGFSTFVWLLKHTTPARVSTYAYVNPIVAVFLGWLVLHEPITGRTLVASAIIIAAVVIITTEKSRAAKAKTG